MHFKIKAECRRGLRVIDDIPDIGLCRVEGHNGIGKSAAVRLLELCTGAQPYERESLSWKTLKEQLLSVEIEITSLTGAGSVYIRAKPSEWPVDPVLLGDQHLQISIDGATRTLDELRRLVRVHRFVGHETLTDTLAFQVTESAAVVRSWITDSGEAWQRRAHLDDLLADAMDLIPSYDVAEYHDKSRQLHELKNVLDREETNLSSAASRAQLLSDAAQLADQLEDVRQQGPSIESQLADLHSEISTLDEESTRIDASITQIAQAAEHDHAARAAFERAQRAATRKEQDVNRLKAKIEQDLRRLDLGSAEETAAAIKGAEVRLKNLVPESFSPEPAAAIIDLLRSVISILTDADTRQLGQEILVEADLMESAWTVSRLLGALRNQLSAREAQLRAIGDDGEDGEVSDLRKKLVSLRALLADVGKLPREQHLLSQAKEKLRRATDKLPPSTGEALRALLEAKSEVDARRQELIARKEQIEQAKALLGGGLNQQVLNQRLTKACRELGIEQSRIHAQHEAIQPRLEALEASVDVLAEKVRLAELELSQDLEKVRNACTEVRKIPWLPAHLGNIIRQADVPVEDQIAFLAQAASALDGVRTRLDRFTSEVQSLAGSLEAVAGQFRTGDRAKGKWVSQVYAWLAEEVRQWFDHEQVRISLFDGGDSVALDLASMAVAWTVKGERRRRSLEAFSSGEQAVAYTRARLARLERDNDLPLNRLVVLDEFGAFISNDSMQSLTAYLADRRSSFPVDQLLVVLPLSANYSAIGGVVTADIVESRKSQLRQRGYFAEEFVW